MSSSFAPSSKAGRRRALKTTSTSAITRRRWRAFSREQPVRFRYRQKQMIQHTRPRDRRYRRAIARELVVPVRAVGAHEMVRDEREMRFDRAARRLVIQPFGARHARLDVFGLRPE